MDIKLSNNSSSSSSMDSNTSTTTKNQFNFNYPSRNMSLLLILIAGVFSLSFLSSNSPKSLLSSQLSHYNQTMTTMWTAKDELRDALEGASFKNNKTVIIAVVNRAYVEGRIVPNMLDLFLEGFWAGEGTRELLHHLIIVAVDQTAYERCLFRGLHCYRLVTDGVDFMGEKVFMSDDFIKMMWSRTLLLLDILKKGYNFIFTDTDVLWLRNPFNVLTTNETRDFDIQFSIDAYNGDPLSRRNPINTGFYFVKSNNKTIALFEKWYALKDNSTGKKEQDVLQNMTWQGVLGDLDIKARYLDTKYFSGFCQLSRDIWSVVTVHANCCRFISAKVLDLSQILRDWTQFRVTPASQVKPFWWSPHSGCIRSWQTKVENSTRTKNSTRNKNNKTL